MDTLFLSFLDQMSVVSDDKAICEAVKEAYLLTHPINESKGAAALVAAGLLGAGAYVAANQNSAKGHLADYLIDENSPYVERVEPSVADDIRYKATNGCDGTYQLGSNGVKVWNCEAPTGPSDKLKKLNKLKVSLMNDLEVIKDNEAGLDYDKVSMEVGKKKAEIKTVDKEIQKVHADVQKKMSRFSMSTAEDDKKKREPNCVCRKKDQFK